MANRLLLAHYNKSTDADYAKGSKTATVLGTVNMVAGKFGKGASVDEASNGQVFYYDEADNIDRSYGTLEFWIKTLVDFAIPPSGGDYRYLINTPGVLIGTTGLNQPAHGNSDAVRIDFTVPVDVSISTTKLNSSNVGVWHHYAFTWNKDRGVQIFEDGVRILNNNTAFTPSGSANDIIRIFYHVTGQTTRWANAIIDDLAIYDYVKYTADFTVPEIPIGGMGMKTLLTNIKNVITSASALSYVKKVEVIGENSIPPIYNTQTPWIGIAPISSPERWISNQKKEVVHTVKIYIANYFQKMETAIIGDANNRGMIDVIKDVWDTLRGNTFSDYIDKPCDLELTDYSFGAYDEKYYLCIGVFTLTGNKVFESFHQFNAASSSLERTERVLTNIKDRIATLTDVKKVEIVLPRILPALMITDVPWVGVAPILTPEEWKAMRKEATDSFEIYVVTDIQLRETAIMGDDNLQGSLDIVSLVAETLRGETFNNDLARPIDMEIMDYELAQFGDGYYVFVPTIRVTCKRLFNV